MTFLIFPMCICTICIHVFVSIFVNVSACVSGHSTSYVIPKHTHMQTQTPACVYTHIMLKKFPFLKPSEELAL